MSQVDRKSGLGLLLIGYLSFFVIAIPGGIFNIAWVHIQVSFDLPLDALGTLLIIRTSGAIILTFASGQIMSRVSLKLFLLAGSFFAGLGLLAYAFSTSWETLLLASFFAGLGPSALIVGTNTYAAENYSASRLNWLHACFGLGQTIGPVIVTIIVIDGGHPWQWCYAVASLPYFVLTALFVFTLNRWKLNAELIETDPTTPAGKTNIRETLALSAIWFSMALFFVSAGAEISTGQLANSLFTEGRSIAPKTASTWVSFYWFFFTLGRLVFGVVIDRVGSTRLLRFCMFGSVLGGALLWWNPNNTFSFIGLALIGFSLSTIAPTLTSGTPRLVGPKHTPNAVGLQSGAAILGITLLPSLGALLAGNFDVAIIAPFLFAITLGMFLLHEFIVLRASAPRSEKLCSQ